MTAAITVVVSSFARTAAVAAIMSAPAAAVMPVSAISVTRTA